MIYSAVEGQKDLKTMTTRMSVIGKEFAKNVPLTERPLTESETVTVSEKY